MEEQWEVLTKNKYNLDASWQSFVHSINGAIGLFKRDQENQYQTLYIDQNLANLLGYHKAEFYKRFKADAFALVYQDDQAIITAMLKSATRNNTSTTLSFRLVCKNKQIQWVNGIFWVENKNSEIIIKTIIVPISKQLELQIKALDKTEIGIHVIDLKTRELYYSNSAGYRILDAIASKYAKKTCYQIFFNRNEPCEECSLDNVLLGNDHHEIYIPTLNRTFLTIGEIMTWQGLDVYVEYMSDITEQKKESIENEALVNQLKTVIHNVPGAVCLYRYNGFKLQPLVVSEQYSQMLGVDALKALNDTQGLNFKHVHPDDLKGVQEAVADALNGIYYMNYTYRSYNEKKKDYLWINVQAKSISQPDGSQYVYVTYTDVSKDKEIELRLRESERSLEAATDVAKIWYWVYDLKNDIGYIGNKIKRLFGLPHQVDNFVETWLNTGIIDQAYHDDYRRMVANVRAGVKEAHVDCRGYLNDGSVHWFRFLLKNINPSNMRAIGIASIIDDIKEIEEKYEIEKKRTLINDGSQLGHGLFNLTTNEVIELDSHGVIDYQGNISFNELGCQIATKIENKSQRDFFLSIHDSQLMLKKYYQGHDEFQVDYSLKKPDGKIIWVRTLFHMMNDPESNDVLLFDYCYDINRQKTIEIMMNFAVNDDYDLLGSVNFYDNSAIMMFGKNSYNVTGSNYVEEDYTISLERLIANAIVPEERMSYLQKASIERIKMELKDKDSYEFYFKMKKNGQIRTKKARYVRHQDDKDICLWNQTDVTQLMNEEQKKQDQLKVALDKAKCANSSKTTFLSQMSHEIRTPMNAIIGMTHLALDTDQLTEKDEYLRKIDASSHFLLGIINDILDMSRIESGRFELHPQWTPASEIFYSCVNMLMPEMNRKGIKFICPKAKRIGEVEFYVDSLRMQQIYMNILNNALKFTPPGGIISMVIENKWHDDFSSVDLVTISDTGCGMSSEFLTRIFQPFEQEQNPYSKMVQGTGLGLALVKQILDAMGGEIFVTSTLNKGSTFSFTIPYKYRFAKNKRVKLEYIDVDLTNRRILLADDHPLNRQIATKLLEKKNMLVESAVDGQQVIELFSQAAIGYYDVILMDIKMPLMDGLMATREIRKLNRPDAKTIPIIAMTANAFDDDVQTSLDAGMNEHLAKPIEPQKLYAAIARNLNAQEAKAKERQ